MEDIVSDPLLGRKELSYQKNFRLSITNLDLLEKIKNINPRSLNNNFVINKILESVLPRILEHARREKVISLNDIEVIL